MVKKFTRVDLNVSAPSVQFCVIFLTLFLHFFTFHFCNYFFQDCSLLVWIITIVPVKMVKISCFWFNNLEQPANAMIVFFFSFFIVLLFTQPFSFCYSNHNIAFSIHFFHKQLGSGLSPQSYLYF